MSEEHKRKIGEAVKRGRYLPCAQCGKDFYIKPWEEKRKDSKKCCSKECFREKHRTTMTGRKNPAWRGGSSSRSQNGEFVSKKAWRRFVLERDKYTCKNCGLNDKDVMEVDHVVPVVSGGKTEPTNLQTLCKNCHHKKTVREKADYAGK